MGKTLDELPKELNRPGGPPEFRLLSNE